VNLEQRWHTEGVKKNSISHLKDWYDFIDKNRYKYSDAETDWVTNEPFLKYAKTYTREQLMKLWTEE